MKFYRSPLFQLIMGSTNISKCEFKVEFFYICCAETEKFCLFKLETMKHSSDGYLVSEKTNK